MYKEHYLRLRNKYRPKSQNSVFVLESPPASGKYFYDESGSVGKTHLAQALGHEACRRGYTTLFVKSAKMLRGLFAARADHSWERQLKKYTRPDLLIIDDFWLTVLTPIQAEDFYKVVTERHLRSSMLITGWHSSRTRSWQTRRSTG